MPPQSLLDYLVEHEPAFKRPRLPSLYLDFTPLKTSNPDVYYANISAWRAGLSRLARDGLLPSSPSSSSSTSSSSPNKSKNGSSAGSSSGSCSGAGFVLCSGEPLLRALESKQFGRPDSLGTAMREAIADGEFVSLETFLASTKPLLKNRSKSAAREGSSAGGGWGWENLPVMGAVRGPASWAAWVVAIWAVLGLVIWPIWGIESWAVLVATIWAVWMAANWAVRQVVGEGFPLLRSGENDTSLPEGEFVIVENVIEAGRIFAERWRQKHLSEDYGGSRFERVYPRSHFTREFASLLGEDRLLTEKDMSILLTYLSREEGLLIFTPDVVKLLPPTHSREEEDTVITPEDASIAHLRTLHSTLTHQTSLLENRIAELHASAKLALAKQNRISALAALKSKKLAEDTLSKRYSSLNQVESLIAQIENAADNVALVRVMESSAAALDSLTSKLGGVEKVRGVVDVFKEKMSDVDEIAAILAEAAAPGGVVVDEGELDEELEELAKEEEEKAAEQQAEEVAKRLEQVGNVPEGLRVPSPVEETEGNEKEKVSGERESVAKLMSTLSLKE